MYEASGSGGAIWLRQGWVVRQAWMKRARGRLDGVGSPGNRPHAWWNVRQSFRILQLLSGVGIGRVPIASE
jgi:hypothetical protein